MSNFVKDIVISNFKSIKHLELDDCKRINLFIGKPNVGKSNITEALSLFSLPYVENIRDLIRLENAADLFFDGNANDHYLGHQAFDSSPKPPNAGVKAGDMLCLIYAQGNQTLNFDIEYTDDSFKVQSGEDGSLHAVKGNGFDGIYKNLYPIKKYSFFNQKKTIGSYSTYLRPPYGENLFEIINKDTVLRAEFSHLFEEYGLKLVFEQASKQFKAMRINADNNIYLVPFSSIADTLQRIIFYKTAIESNTNSILILEEPEVHSFPPYISYITQSVINADSNQFFITTHSPYVLNDFLENSRDELAIFMVDLKNGETTTKRLTDDELKEIYEDGVDLFMNFETYL